ncbi:MAG: hypothetical protein HN742_03395 [Lentisphaerae bacterium]|nr:hypothetical protein [Lentisphaerota bacterium]MBT5605515.1 hypothetical protein [Lentisphaerota bacterium]MBT7060054.1 hypothetical protein [Lentisphaerota bacterium]MBT7840886.1 hypothetical protein [Lentisphaerota bacterium]
MTEPTSDRGGGALLLNSSPIIAHCEFAGNTSLIAGAGLHIEGGAPFFRKCKFVDNATAGTGGGVSASGSSPSLDRCGFLRNTADSRGGGSWHSGTGVTTLANCLFRENSASIGGGVAAENLDVNSGSLALVNTLLAMNSATDGGGLAAVAASPILTNCTLAGNTADRGGALWAQGGGTIPVANSILWGNTASTIGPQFAADGGAATASFTTCNVDGAGGSGAWDAAFGTDQGGNLDADPLFMNPAALEFSLQSGSPCIDAALTTVAGYQQTDRYDRPRYDDPGAPNADPDSSEAPDMGAFEYSVVYVGIAGSDGTGTGRPDAPYATIQLAIDLAEPGGDVVIFGGTDVAPAVFTGPGNVNLTFRGKEITVRSDSPEFPERTIIDCGGEDGTRGVHFESGETTDSLLEGITIRNGRHSYGGGIACEDGVSPTIRRCVLESNTAYAVAGDLGFGGGFYARDASPDLIECEIRGNTAEITGGGVFVEMVPDDGGYTQTTGGSRSPSPAGYEPKVGVHMSLCRVTGNSAQFTGGGIYCSMAGIKIADTLVSDNTARDGAGIMLWYVPTAVVERSLLHQNAASAGDGGGLRLDMGEAAVQNTTIHGNSAASGGGLMVRGGALIARNVTVTDNSAETQGGGIFGMSAATVDLANAIVWGNTVGEEPDELVLVDGSTAAVQYTAITAGWAGTNNISADPMLEPLADNGGPTQTRQLASGSPAIDAGSDSEAAGMQNDQRGPGYIRSLDADGDQIANVDLGAVERSESAGAGDDTAEIHGRAWFDVNVDGLHDDDEPAFASLPLVLLGPAGPLPSTVTDADGAYSFRALSVGSYAVKVLLPHGYRLTNPVAEGSRFDAASHATPAIVLASGSIDVGWDLGLVLDAISPVLPGGVVSRATDISAAGAVVGFERWADDSVHPFRELSTAGRSPVGTASPVGGTARGTATAVSDSGTTVGHLFDSTGQPQAFVWDTESAEPRTILPAGSEASMAWAIYGDTVVGSAGAAVPDGAIVYQACVWEGVERLDLGTLGGAQSVAYAINARGEIVGESATATSVTTAFLYRDGQMVPLDPNPPYRSVAYDISDSGVIVGQRADADGALKATRWREGEAEELAGLGGVYSCALAVNAEGRAVGWAENEIGALHAVLWDARGAVLDLNGLLWGAAGEWDLQSATAINDAGDVVGYGLRDGVTQAFRFAVPAANLPAMAEAPHVLGQAGAWGVLGEPLLLAADGVDLDGEITHVVFLIGEQEIPADMGRGPKGTLLADGPFTVTVEDLPVGVHEVRIRVTDSDGATAVSPPTFVSIYERRVPATDDAYSTEEFAVLEPSAPGVLANDSVTRTSVREVTLLTEPAKGTVALSADGSFVYVSDPSSLSFDDTAEESDQFTYEVRAEGYAPGQATVMISITRSELVFNLPLQTGWNLISVPLAPLDSSVEAVLGSTIVGPVWGWQDGDYVSVQALSPGMGYWVFHDGDATTIPIHGHAVRDAARELPPGWHLVGAVSAPDFAPSRPEWLVRPDGAATPRPYAWDGTGYVNDNELRCGSGYWMEVRRGQSFSLGGIRTPEPVE